MVFERYVDGYDQCDPPFCNDDISVEIVEKSCANSNLEVGWVIHDEYNRIFADVEPNTLFWSVNSQDLNLEADAYNSTSPYRASVDVAGLAGIVYLQVVITINGITFRSPVETFDINNCADTSVNMVKAKLCEHCEAPQIPKTYDLYVKEQAFSDVPRYFSYDGACWYLDSDAWDNRILIDESLGIVLDSLDETYLSCEECCLGLICPDPIEWISDGGDGFYANFYIEYTTYTIRDHIVVVSNFNLAECPMEGVAWDRILWESGCVGTGRTNPDSTEFPRDCVDRPCSEGGEGPGTYITDGTRRSIQGDDPLWSHRFGAVKAACFLVHSSQLPLGIWVNADCDEDHGSEWCAYVEGPELELTVCDHDIDECAEIEVGLSSSSSSSISSSSSSSSVSSSSTSSSSISSSSSSSSSISDSSSSSSSSSVSSSGSSVSSSSSSVSSSSSSVSSSSMSSSSQSSSSQSLESSESSESSHALGHHHRPEAFFLNEYAQEEFETQYDAIKHEFVGLTDVQKEDKLIEMVSNGEITVHLAVFVAIQEKLDVDA